MRSALLRLPPHVGAVAIRISGLSASGAVCGRGIKGLAPSAGSLRARCASLHSDCRCSPFRLLRSYITLIKFCLSTLLLCHWMACLICLVKSLEREFTPEKCTWDSIYFRATARIATNPRSCATVPRRNSAAPPRRPRQGRPLRHAAASLRFLWPARF